MSRYLSCGVSTAILVSRKRNVELLDYKDKILKELEKYFNLDDYDMEMTEEHIKFKLNLDIFNDNIYELIKELEPINTAKSTILFGKNLDVSTLSKDVCNIRLKTYDENYEFESEYEKNNLLGSNYLIVDDELYDEVSPLFLINVWTFFNKSELYNNFQIDYTVIQLWCDFWKYAGESEVPMLHILNTMKSSYYKIRLSKGLIYTVIG